MQFLDELNVIETKMTFLTSNESYLALSTQKRMLEQDLEDAKSELERARLEYLRTMMQLRLN